MGFTVIFNFNIQIHKKVLKLSILLTNKDKVYPYQH